MMEMPKSTLLRLLTTMKYHNLIRQDESTKRFSLGLGLVALGRSAEKNFDLVDKIHPYLIELAEKTGETASLMTLEGDHGIYADQVLSKSMIRGQPRIGMRLDLYCSSAGKILLSGMEDSRIDSLFGKKELTRRTTKTIDSFERLKKEVQKVRDQGYAVDDEEVEIGGRCIAAPLRGKNGEVIAAISVMGPTTRIRQKDFARVSKIVREVVRKASRSFGYQGD